MDFLQLAKTRYAARQYQDRPVEQEKLDIILEAGRVAPTACNNQPQRVLVVRTPEGMEKLSKGYKTFGAPVALIVCANHEESWRRSYDGLDSAQIDASIVTDHMCLCAADQGIGSVWVCAFNPTVIREEFAIPQEWEPVNILLLGYADGKVRLPDRHDQFRKPLTETVFYDHF
ncbi:nitroreductase family protein [Oscillospiraceae bacterium MB08-C2-2]|nr:nitroreductase family protein [Oscillospiraceae bacterium MB08-C2-2]